MSWWQAIRLLRDCPAILRVGVRAARLLLEAIDEGRDDVARDRLEVALSARRGQAAGRAAKASSDAATAAGKRNR